MNNVADELIDSIYEAAFIPEQWPTVLEAVARKAEALGGVMFTLDSIQQGNWTSTANMAEAVRRFVKDGYVNRNVRPGRGLATRYAGFMADLDVMTQEEIDSDPIYRDVLRPMGFGWSCGSVIPAPSGDLMVFDFDRSLGMGPFDRRSLNILDFYRPHLARAGLLATRTQIARIDAASAVMATLGLPGAVLGAGGRVLAVTSLLEGFPDQISIQAGDRLRLANKRSDKILNEALAGIDREEGQVRSIPVTATKEASPLVVHVIPIRRHAHDIFARAVALLVATPIGTPTPPHAGLLCGLFDLTPAEDRVARAFAEGHSIQTSAAALSVSQETIRTQLKRVMSKTGTSRQSELIRLLAGATTIPIRPD